MSGAVQLVRDPIDPAALMARVARPAHGALILFLGVVRDVNDGRGVTGIEYSAYEGMAARELESIADEAGGRFGGADVAIEHRLGDPTLEGVSVGISGAHAHREPAYAASRA